MTPPPPPASRPTATSASVATRMSRQARRDTAQEVAVRRLLHAEGLRYRVAYPVQGRPRRTIDIAFTRARLAVFLDGCFWHSCPQHATSPVANSEWWASKLARNVERDRDTDFQLTTLGWTVTRHWEHEDPTAVAGAVRELLSDIRHEPARRPGSARGDG